MTYVTKNMFIELSVVEIIRKCKPVAIKKSKYPSIKV